MSPVKRSKPRAANKDDPGSLVGVAWLAKHLDDPELRLVHVSPDRRVYNKRHIRGATYSDLHKEIALRGTAPETEDAERQWLIPSPEQTAAVLRRWRVGEGDRVVFYDDIGVHDNYTGVVLDPEEGRRIGASLGRHKAVILRNHGMLTVGETVDSAAWWFLTLERTAQAQLMAYSAAAGHGSKPIKIDAEEAAATRGQVGFELAGWFQFQPIWERISKDNPDLFD